MKKVLSIVVATVIIVLLLSACNTNNPPSKAESPQAEKPTGSAQPQKPSEKIKFSVWSRDTEDSTTGKAFKSDMEAFKKLHPEIEFEFLHINHADVVTKWNTAFAGGTAPDVMDVGVSHIVGRVELGHIIPLDDYFNSWDDKENLASGMVDYGRYGDRIYALAYNASPAIMAWRKDYFEQAGLEPDRAPKDWEEFVEYVKKLTVKEGNTVKRGGVDLPDTRGAHILWQFFLQNDAQTIDYANDIPNFNQPAAIEAAKLLENIAPYAILNSGGLNEFMSGNAAISLHISPDAIRSMINEDPSLQGKIGYQPTLINKKGGNHCGAWLYSISSQSKNPDLAWEWIKFIFTEERCRVRMNEFKIVPPMNSLSEEYIAKDPDLNRAQLKNLVQSQAYPKLSWTNVYEESLHLAYDQILYGEKTAEQAMIELQNTIMSKIQ